MKLKIRLFQAGRLASQINERLWRPQAQFLNRAKRNIIGTDIANGNSVSTLDTMEVSVEECFIDPSRPPGLLP